MALYWQPCQESDVYAENDEQLIPVQGDHSMAQPVGSQLHLLSRPGNILLASPDYLSEAIHSLEERSGVAFEQDEPLRQDSTDFDPLLEEIDSSQAVEQATRRWSPESSIPVNYNANDNQPIQIQSNDSTAATFSELQRQPESRQEYLFDQTRLDGSYNPVQTPVPGASHTWMAEGQNDMTLENDNPSSQPKYRTNFNFGYNYEQSIQPESLQENYFGSYPAGSGEFPYMSYTSLQTPPINAMAAERNDMAFGQSSHLSQKGNDFNFQRQPVGENEYSQAGNSRVLSRLDIPSSGAAGPSTSSTTTLASAQSSPSAAWPHHNADGIMRKVGSLRIQEAAARRRKKPAIHQCSFGNCNCTFTETFNLGYHINGHLNLRPYSCVECSYAASSPATLKRHMKRHQNV